MYHALLLVPHVGPCGWCEQASMTTRFVPFTHQKFFNRLAVSCAPTAITCRPSHGVLLAIVVRIGLSKKHTQEWLSHPYCRVF